jgi:uncharacterized protein YgiM (DUF1202 family)
MRRSLFIFCLIFFVTGFAAAQVSVGGTLYVSVNTLTLKSGAGFFAGNQGTLNYGDRVMVISVNGRFAEIRSSSNSSIKGWTATANLSAKQILSGNTNTASAKEVALAGKGFSREIEDSYKLKEKANYADVDKAEKQSVKEADLKKFIEEGRLAAGE